MRIISRRVAQIINEYVSSIPREKRLRWTLERKMRSSLSPLVDRRDEIDECECCGQRLGTFSRPVSP